MADSKTTHLELIKQDPTTPYDYEKQDTNLETLDSEIFARGKKFNGEAVGPDGEFHIRTVPYAENLETSASQSSDDEYVIRTSGGEASISDGDAWLTLLKGSRRHINYVPQSIVMTVTPMERQPAPAITAVLDAEVFEAYVGDSGTYTISYTNAWSLDPALYGITVSNTPIEGDSITVAWDGENEPEMTVNAATRPTPESISATIDDEVFVSYVTVSGTTTLTYSTQWSADPTLYGITVNGTPIAGDVITVVYVKEVRGTIIQSNPQTFVSTGWNLFNYTDGYARVIKYSDSYGFKIAGTYTGLEFSETISGSRITITPVSGYFTIPSDGYIFVSGGNETDTELWMTWSDWGNEPNGGVFAPYETHAVDFSTFMATNFPYGLMQVGTIRDEINLNTGVAASNVLRQDYNATNLANAKASGRQYEYDENYIYIERATAVTYEFTVDGDYVAFDHGMEYFTGTEQAVYAGTIYGANLKNKLERDVLTISQQTLTVAQKAQVQQNIGAASKNSISRKELGNHATLSSLETAIYAVNSAMSDGDVQVIAFTTTFTDLNAEIDASQYNGLLYRQSSDILKVHAISNNGKDLYMAYYVNDWNISSLSGKIAKYGSCVLLNIVGTLEELGSQLLTLIRTLTDGEQIPVRFGVKSTYDTDVFEWLDYTGFVTRLNYNQFAAEFINNKSHTLTIATTNGGTSYDYTNINSKITNELAYGSIATDCNIEIRRMFRAGSDTLNTPYKQGITNSREFYIINTQTQTTNSWCQQFALTVGNNVVFVRNCSNGTWSDWVQLALNTRIDNLINQLPSEANIDNIKRTCFAFVQSPTSSSFSGDRSGSLYSVFNVDGSRGTQTIVGIWQDKIWSRRYTGQWEGWKEITLA